jgi:hypothetical protein
MLFQKGDGGDPLYGVRQGQIRSETFAARFVAFEKVVASSVGCSSPFSKGTDQFFSSRLIRLSNSSNEIAPLILSPLMKKVGVALTFSTSSASFSSADSWSNRA